MSRWRSHRPLPEVDAAHFPAKEIVKNLWIGSEGDVRGGPGFIEQHDIRLVINATGNLAARRDVPTYRIPVDDDPSENPTMLQHLPVAVAEIDASLRRGGGVLVHCKAGMQRSAAVVAAYLMWKRGMTADKAFEFINRKKHETFFPWPTFEAALRAWEDMLH